MAWSSRVLYTFIFPIVMPLAFYLCYTLLPFISFFLSPIPSSHPHHFCLFSIPYHTLFYCHCCHAMMQGVKTMKFFCISIKFIFHEMFENENFHPLHQLLSLLSLKPFTEPPTLHTIQQPEESMKK